MGKGARSLVLVKPKVKPVKPVLSLQVRIAQPKDLPTVYRLYRSFWQPAESWTEFNRQARVNLRDAQLRYLVATLEDNVLGYAVVVRDLASQYAGADLTQLVVSKQYQRQGVGSALFQGALEWCRSNKTGHMHWVCGSDSYAFYAVQGAACKQSTDGTYYTCSLPL